MKKTSSKTVRDSDRSLWSLKVEILTWYLCTSNSFVPKEEKSAYSLLLQCLWVNLSAKCEFTHAGNSILISGFVIFSSFIILHCKLFQFYFSGVLNQCIAKSQLSIQVLASKPQANFISFVFAVRVMSLFQNALLISTSQVA